MTKYRSRQLNLMSNVWILEKRFLLIFWICKGAGSEKEVKTKCYELNGKIKMIHDDNFRRIYCD